MGVNYIYIYNHKIAMYSKHIRLPATPVRLVSASEKNKSQWEIISVPYLGIVTLCSLTPLAFGGDKQNTSCASKQNSFEMRTSLPPAPPLRSAYPGDRAATTWPWSSWCLPLVLAWAQEAQPKRCAGARLPPPSNKKQKKWGAIRTSAGTSRDDERVHGYLLRG